MMTKTGTLAFSAPEIFTALFYDEKVDLWSAGTVLYMMLCGQQPFEHEHVPKLIQMITYGDYNMDDAIWAKVSFEGKELIR
jgi:calcium/calmodulin-dependent protein kinase I